MAQRKHEGRPFRYEWNDERFEDALKMACTFLDVKEFNTEQRNALKSYFKDLKDIYFSAPTGHGNSLIFQHSGHPSHHGRTGRTSPINNPHPSLYL